MGAFYNSICVPGDEHRRVRASLLRWLGGKGLVPSEKAVLFDLDGETERCAFLVWNDRWTLLFFSKYEEERRLIRELQSWADPVLYLWVQDSDVWGYDLFDGDGFTASFNSDPRTYRSFADDAGDRPAADPEDVCRRLGLAEGAAELSRIHRRRAVFMEDVCGELCRLIDAEPALTTYDELERGTFETLDGWRVEQLLFEIPRDAGPIRDLHEIDLGDRKAGTGSARVEIPPEVLAEIERRRTPRWTILLLRPLSWLARTLRGAYEAPSRARRRRPRAQGRQPPPEMKISRYESSDVIEVRHLINERHRCRIRLAVGAKAKSGFSKPASVFAFEIGNTAVTCTARRRSQIREVLQRPNRSKILRDEKYAIGGLEARHVVFELPPYYLAGTSGPSYLGLHVVQTDAALYVFLYRFPRRIVKEVERTIRATVSSFRLLA